MNGLLIGILASTITLLIGALFTRISSDKKLEKLGDDLKEEIKKSTTPIETISKSVVELDRNVIALIERISAQNSDVDELKNLVEDLTKRLRELEGIVQVLKSQLNSTIDSCNRRHDHK